MKYYHGPVQTENLAQSDQAAQELAQASAQVIADLSGTISVSRAFGESPAILVVGLPDEVVVTPSELIGGGVTFTLYQS